MSRRRSSGLMHRRVVLLPVGANGAAVANETLGLLPTLGGLGRDVAAMVRFIGITYAAAPATTDVVIKADNSAGATIFTKANVNTTFAPVAVGTAAINATNGPTAATDATAGGFPVRGGINIDVAQADPVTSVTVDVWFDLVRFVRCELNPLGGAGTSAVNKDVRIGEAGVIRAVSVTYTNQALTTDLVISADTAGGGGNALLTLTNTNTNIAPKACTLTGGQNASGAAIAATDGTSGGMPFRHLLNFDVAQADDSANGAKPIVVELWIDT